MVARHSNGNWVGGGWHVYPARDLLWVTMVVDPFRDFQTRAAEPRNVGVEAGTDPGPAPMMTCERHELDGRFDGRLLRSERTETERCVCVLTQIDR